jgi:hypothetical protein
MNAERDHPDDFPRPGRRRDSQNVEVFVSITDSSGATASRVAPPSETEESEKWHRRFAMRCNNRAWELSVMPRSAAEDREMLSVAHASVWHWEQVGTELNRMRAKMLLAEVHALLGFGPSAFSLASEILNYFSTRDTPDWEIALTHTIYAHAAHAAGKSTKHRAAYAKAVAAIGVIENAEERDIVSKTFENIPVP